LIKFKPKRVVETSGYQLVETKLVVFAFFFQDFFFACIFECLVTRLASDVKTLIVVPTTVRIFTIAVEVVPKGVKVVSIL
jgi:hypothetical protein